MYIFIVVWGIDSPFFICLCRKVLIILARSPYDELVLINTFIAPPFTYCWEIFS